ncbi:MAG: HAD family hydrolase [Candidatus Hodarchaeales archaeon]
MTQGISCIIFDFDGTLVDTKTYYMSLVAEYLGAELEAVKSKADLTTFSKISHKEENIKWKILFASFKASKALDYSTIKSLGAVKYLIRNHSKNFHKARPTAHLEEALSILRKNDIKLAILSHSSRVKVMRFLNQYFPNNNYFDPGFILTSGEFGKHKETGIRKILSLFNSENEPNRCAIVGDLGGDIYAGKNTGLTTIGLTTGYSSHSILKLANPDAIFQNTLEMANSIQ